VSKAAIKLLKKSEIKQGELANILGVSRMTVNNWMCGRRAVHVMMQKKVTLVALAINKAIEENELPYRGPLKGFERLKKMRRIIATGITKLPTKA
jgi:transcriptional regulator with XRE-family HTH domain